ncbi:MAG: winged helix-turn-helix domain-containing protein [Gemmataceae bacterium]|nr:winged helix-turn-helix domain-containing protein [Gemmataceae bacterium]
MEARRRQAVRRVADGRSRRDVADFLGVHPVTVGKRVRAHRPGGGDGLAARPHPGRAPFLTAARERRVLGWVADRPTAHGFPTDLRTARRVADLIRRRLGVEFHPAYLREWLARRGLSPQKPAERARERDPDEVGRWPADDWPAIQKRGPAGGPASS